MMNQTALKQSESSLAYQIEILKNRLPYIAEVYPCDSHINMRADYMENVDAYAVSGDARHYNIQFKVRNEGNNDFVLIAKKLTGKSAADNNIGFEYKNNKYTFDLKSADIYVETLGNGYTHILTREEINALERQPLLGLSAAVTGIQPKIVYKDDGSTFPSGDYYVFIDGKELNQLKRNIVEFEIS